MDTDDAKKEEEKQEGEKKEGESSSTASGAAPSSSLVMGEELNKMVKNIMESDNHVPQSLNSSFQHFCLSAGHGLRKGAGGGRPQGELQQSG